MAARRKPPEEIRKFWRLLDLPIEAMWAALNTRTDAADFTTEALMFSLRRGVEALGHPQTLRRLSQLSERQLIEVMVRLQKLTPEIAPAWTPDQVEVVAAVRRKL